MIVDKMDGGEVSNGEWVSLVRHRNKYDSNAIRVLNKQERKIGYLEADQSAILAPLMDKDLIRVSARVYKGCNDRHTPVTIFVCGDAEDVDKVYVSSVRSEQNDEIDEYSESEIEYMLKAQSDETRTLGWVKNQNAQRMLERIEYSAKQSTLQPAHSQTCSTQYQSQATEGPSVMLGAAANCPATATVANSITTTNSSSTFSLETGLNANSEEILAVVLPPEAIRFETTDGEDIMSTAMSMINSEVRTYY